MKKILLVGVNSRYNHVSLAVRTIDSYVKKYSADWGKTFQTCTRYFTINQPLTEILREIVFEKPDVVLFSVYIWNVQIAMNVVRELKKILPHVVAGAGGPEVSYCSADFLKKNPDLDFVMAGEGEETVRELCEQYSRFENEAHESFVKSSQFAAIKGLYIRSENVSEENGCSIKFTGYRPLIDNLDSIPFCYDDGNGNMAEGVSGENSIIYYESSRGCPFGCSYCLSSVEKSVRFKSLECVKRDIDFFMNHRVSLVKFVDRTFNLKEERYVAIWNYIIQTWNGITKFHFEIEAQTMTDGALEALKNVPYGCMQFEIGIQSINGPTLEAVGRNFDADRQTFVLSNIPETIHVHVDLIAGLPYESLAEFPASYDYAIRQKCQMVQLGFLKILHGTQMETFALQHDGYRWLSVPPYEVLCSPWVSYENMQFLKNIDFLTDSYYNSQEYCQTMKFVVGLQKSGRSTFEFFRQLQHYFSDRGLFENLHKSPCFFDYLHDFVVSEECSFFSSDEKQIVCELLKFDYIRKGKVSTFPVWYERFYDKDRHVEALNKFHDMHSTRQAYIDSAYEQFEINPFTCQKSEGRCEILFVYNSEHMKGSASKTAIRSGDTLCIEIK